MEKSNSFKRVLAGTLALLTVASSVPADAGSVIGNFFSTALVANAEAAPVERTVAVTNLAISGNAGTAKVKVGNNEVVDATVAVTTPDENAPNVKQLVITTTANAFADGNAFATVDGYTVIDTIVDAKFNATATTTTLTVKVNKFTSITANGATEYEFDGTPKEIKYGKHIADEAALDTDGNNTVEVAYIDADGVYQVITEDEIKTASLFDYYFDAPANANYLDAASVEGYKRGSLAACAETNVKRKDNINSTVIPHVITLVGKGKYEGLVVDTNLLITPLDISSSATVTADEYNTFKNHVDATDGKYHVPHVTYNRGPAGDGDIIQNVKVKDKADAAEHTISEGVGYTLSYEGREDTEAGQTGVLTDADGKINDNATLNVNAVNVGLYTATLNYGGNYTGTAKQSFRIVPAELTVDQIKGSKDAYDKDAVEVTHPTVALNPVTQIKNTAAPKFTGTLAAATKVYDRTSDCAVVKAQGDADEFGLTLTTYKAEVKEDGSFKTDANGDKIWTQVNDAKNVGTYKTVVTVSGNYKVAEADKDKEAAIEWTVTAYDISTDPAATAENDRSRFVDDTSKWAGFAVNPASGNIEAAFNLRDNVETDLAAQAGALLNLGTDFTVEYRKHAATETAFADKLPDGLTSSDKIDVRFTGTGNYKTTTPVVVEQVPISAYTLTPGDTVLTKKVGNLEQVKYQYGDTITAAVQGVPQVLTQESRYYKVLLDTNGAPVDGATNAGTNYATLKTKVKAVTDADAQIAAATTDEERTTAITTKNNAIDDLYNATIAANAPADETANVGYVVVVFVNRNGDKYKTAPTDADKAKYNDGYKSFFDSAVGVSKGITISKRTVSDSSTVEVEFDNPLLPYIGRAYKADELEANIKSVKVDGVALDKDAATGLFDDFTVVSTKADNTDAIKDVDNYSIKLKFGDDTTAISDNFKGSYTTNANTQKLSIVSTQLTAADFNVNNIAIVAVLAKDGQDNQELHVGSDAYKNAIAPYDSDRNPNGGWTVVEYKACQTGEQYHGNKILYTGNETKIAVTPIAPVVGQTAGQIPEPIYAHAPYGTDDFQITGDTQTDAGPYELTISGVKNTKGVVTVKWSIEGNTFDGFTATPDKSTFDYNGQGQAPSFTVVKPADTVNNLPAVTLTEGKDFAVEYYSGTTKLDGKPANVGTYTAKIVGIGAYYGAKYKEEGAEKAFTFTIAPASDLSITITPKDGADFSYNGEALKDRVTDLFDIEVEGKKLEEDADNFIYHIVTDETESKDARQAKNVGKYKISVTVYDDNYQPKTSDQTPFEITPKEITLSNITANVKTAVYGAPVAQINDSITFDYDGVIEADADKVSVSDFRGFVVVSDNYRSGSPAGEYTLVYNGNFVPVSEAAQNYKAKKFTSNEKITIAKRDLADAKPFVSLVVVPSSFANADPDYVEKGKELKAEQIIYNGEPYEVYIQDNDNGLMTMADLKLTGTPKALHAGSDLEVVATASSDGNYTGTATLNLAWAVNQCEINKDVYVTIGGVTVAQSTNKLENVVTTALTLPTDGKALFGTAADVAAEKAKYCINTTVQVTTYDYNKGAVAPAPTYNETKVSASEKNGDFTVYFTQLDDKGQPIEDTKTTGYPTTGGKYRAEVEFSKDFKLVNTTAPSEDPDFVPQLAQVGYVDFTVKGTQVDAAIYDLNQLQDDADLTDHSFYKYENKNSNYDLKSTAFTRVYGDAITPNFQIDVYGTQAGNDLVTAKVDVTKMRKFVADQNGAYRIGNTNYSLSDAVYDGTAGYYDLEGAVVMNNTDYSCNFQNVPGFTRTSANTLVYEVKRSTDYTIQFDHENNVFALKNGKAVAGYQVVDDNSGKVMTEGVDYTLKGSNEVYKTGTYTLFVEGIGNYAETAHADWTVVASGADTSVDAKLLDANTVSFKEQVQFNFLAEINDAAYVDGAYVVFTYDHYGEKVENKVPINKNDMYGKYYRFRQDLTASEMAIPVKAELFLKNSAKPVSTKERSIKDYAEAAIAKNLDGADVLKAMLNYGGYTQVALKNNTNLLANASADIKEDVSAIQPKSATPFVRPTPYEGTRTVGIAGIPQSVKIKFTPSVTYKGTTVMTKSKLYVRHYFVVNESMVDEDELNEITVFIPGRGDVALVDLEKNSTGYYFDMDAEMAYNLDRENGVVEVYNFPGVVTNAESYTAAGGQVIAAGATTYKVGAMNLQGDGKHDYADFNDYYLRDANGNIVKRDNEYAIGASNIYAIEIHNYNVVDYCEAIANNSKQSTANKNMVKALYKYYQTAEAYVAKRTKA